MTDPTTWICISLNRVTFIICKNMQLTFNGLLYSNFNLREGFRQINFSGRYHG